MLGNGKRKNVDDKTRIEMKELEKKRRKMIKTRYGQASVKHSKKGRSSCLYAAAVLLLLAAMVGGAYVSKGKLGLLFGFIGLASVVISWLGLVSGVKGFKERNKNYITCKVGIACNTLLLLGLISIFCRGLF